MISIAPPHKKELDNYLTWLEKNQIKYRILTERSTIGPVDSLLLCGGPDIGKNSKRDQFEQRLTHQALSWNRPIIGICRGLQIVNTVMGGLLHDDIKTKVRHTTDKKSIASETSQSQSSFHRVITEDYQEFEVNSRHHQGIKMLAPGLNVTGWAPDGIPEIVEGPNILLVQWHPERREVWNTTAETFVSNWIKSL